MGNRKIFIKSLAMSCALLLLGIFGAPICYAYNEWPELTYLYTEQELVEWYADGVGEGVPVVAIGISGVVHLDASAGERKLSAMNQGLMVQDSGILIMDNRNLILQHMNVVAITVETGGRLEIRQPFYFKKWDHNMPSTIVIEKGGVLAGAENLPYGILVRDENVEPPEPPEPPVVMPPEPPDDRNPITSVMDDMFRLGCVVGERPNSSAYPAAAHVAWLGYIEAPLLPLEWDLSNVNFDTAGIYSAIGKFTQAGLDEHKLSNPTGFTMRMVVQVFEKGPPDKLRGFLLSTGPNGYTLIKLTMPALPMDKVTAIYIYSSPDDTHWKQESWKGQPGTGIYEDEMDFRSLVRTEGRNSEIPFRYQSDGKPVYIRIEVVGSEMSGISNSVHLETTIVPPEERPPEDDDGMGNRGGVGQEETERVLPTVDGIAENNAASRPDVTAIAPSQTDSSSETTDDTSDKILGSTIDEASSQQAITVMEDTAAAPGSPAKPTIPGAVTAAVCTTVAIAATSVLLTCNWQAISKLIQRKS